MFQCRERLKWDFFPFDASEEQVQAPGLVLEVERFDDGLPHEASDGFALGGGQDLEVGVARRACPEVPPSLSRGQVEGVSLKLTVAMLLVADMGLAPFGFASRISES